MQIESYQKKNGTTAYRFRIYIGVIDGKKKYIKRSGFTSKKIAKQALMNLQQEIENPESKSTMLFHELTNLWLNNYEKTVQSSTYLKTKRNIENHILPSLGNYPIKDLTPLIIQKYADEWAVKLNTVQKL